MAEDFGGPDLSIGAYSFRRGDLKSPSENGEATEDSLLATIEERMAPIKRRTKRAVPRNAGATRADQKREEVTEPRGKLGNCCVSQPRGGQLDGERDAVDRPADRDDVCAVCLIQSEAGLRESRSLDEELHSVRA